MKNPEPPPTPAPTEKTYSPETCPPISLGYCELIDRYDPDPPAVALTPYEWAALLDSLQAAVEAGILHDKAAIWAQMLSEKLQSAVFPAKLAELRKKMNAKRAGRN